MRPVESHARGLGLKPLRPKEGGQRGRHTRECRCATTGVDGLVLLDTFPLRECLAGVAHDAVAEYVGVTPGHLRAEAVDDVLHGELSRFRPELAMEHHLEQQVT